MLSIFKKEIAQFFSSLIGYIVIAFFLVVIGLFMWVFSDTSILEYNYATMEQLFVMAPMVFLFLIPAITMSSFAEERVSGTIEFLYTKPLRDSEIVIGKYLANLVLVIIAIIPTLVYYYSIQQLGAPPGNLDDGEVIGSYIGLISLAASFVAVGIFASSITRNQIVAFVLGAFLCFVIYWGFDYLGRMTAFTGTLDAIIQQIGISYHYDNISKGAIDSRDIIYFASVVTFFIYLTFTALTVRRQ
jgi:ABC-2 type transport system permease protein